ncbi:MAG: Ig-like domain-containing protein [Planctomycetaceae bacterium]
MANATPEADEINFDLASGSTIELTTNQITITGSLTINGSGSDELTIAGNGAFGLLSIQESTAAVNVTINGVTLTGGSSGDGGAIHNNSGTVRINDSVFTDNTASSRGGAIHTTETVFFGGSGVYLSNVLLENNSAADGGAIFSNINHVELLNNTRVVGNTATQSGGGVYTVGDGFGGGDTLLVTNSEISGNTAVRGGGIQAINDTVIIQSSIVHSNTAAQDGGGLSTGNTFGEGVVRVRDSEFSGNTAVRGGGIFNSGDFLEVRRSLVAGNKAIGDLDGPLRGSALGGGIYSSSSSTTQFFVTESVVSQNTATTAENSVDEAAVGGGIYAGLGASFARSAFVENQAVAGDGDASSAFGGAVAITRGNMLTSNLTFSGNQSDGNGGAIALFENAASVSLTSATMTNNLADANQDGVGMGGAVWSESTTPIRLDSSIIAGNFRRTDTPDDVVAEATNTSDHNLIGVGVGLTGITNGVLGNQIGTAANPIDPLIGPLQDNGGPSPTHALLPGSPAINAGDTSNDVDQRLVDRPDDDADRDIGAYELVDVNDFGDAPVPYPTTLAENGARHAFGGLFLGESVDAEDDGVHSADGQADRDDSSQTDDEDGVVFVDVVPGFSGRVEVTASAAGFLNAWVDMDLSGSWEGSEAILDNHPVVAGLNVIDFDLPPASSDASANYDTISRFRLSSDGNLSPTGAATDGEVEDHVLRVKQIIIPSIIGDAGFGFNLLGGPREIEWYDPEIAVGYDYTVDDDGDNFTSVKLPAGFGDDIFTLEFVDADGADRSITLSAFEEYDFEDPAQGNTPGGVAAFRITGIERDEGLDPDDEVAFATGIAFGDADENGEAVVKFTMTPLATAIAEDDSYSTDEDIQLDGSSVLANDTDRNDDVLTAELVSGPNNGALQLNEDGTFAYTPDAEFSGTDSFIYVANDGLSVSDPATVTITVEDVNDPPVAENDTDSTRQNTAVEIDVLANDSDAEDDDLSPRIVAGPANGTAEVNADGTLTYSPNDGFSGTDSFTYVVNDGTSDSNEATVTITVEDEGNDDPTVEVIPDPLDPTRTALLVNGTSGDDVIVFKRRRYRRIEVRANGETLGRFADIDVIIANGLAGNDRITISGSVYADSRLFGNGGNDQLRAGRRGKNLLDGGAGNDFLRGSFIGSTVLVGGSGDDQIYGGILSRDILIGGTGADNLYGGRLGRSILIGGTTSHDNNIVALSALQSEWKARRSTASRIDNLTNGGGRNGDYTLEIGETVQQDAATDRLFGGWFSDWFFELDSDSLRNVGRNDFVARE